MRIAISHTTRYRFDTPVRYGVQRLRLRPRECGLQSVLSWQMTVEGAVVEASYDDHNGNATSLISLGGGVEEVVIKAAAMVETRDASGVMGAHAGFMPLWLFTNQTDLTRPGPKLRALAGKFAIGDSNAIEVLHALSDAIAGAITYEKGATHAATTAEQAMALGKGVCQDHAHAFIGAARQLGVPARYVSGYLVTDMSQQEAGHGWAEAHVPGLGWVGFDPSNAMCPDARYVRVALGADYREAAPVTSLSQGGGTSDLDVSLEVMQQVMAQ